ncbi:MAG: GNAT family N-acetyltransferase [Polyangiaceae bacterium]
MRIIDCSEAEHATAILEILNDAIVNSTALYDYAPRPAESMRTWFELKRTKGFPVLGAVDDAGRLLGFASYGTFRAFPAYKYTVESSVYVERNCRGGGVGVSLMRRLIERAEQQNVHVLVGGIDMDNRASIRLHEKLGFVHSGIIRQAGFKFGRWLDLGFYQLTLATPTEPIDG